MSDAVLEELKAGVRRFRAEVYAGQEEMYRRAAVEPQQPDALVIACADSRVHPDQLMQAGPGKIFVTRNVGNLVPVYGEMMGSTSAVIEYAVSFLKVKHIVVCGHTDCGAMKGVLAPEAVAAMPAVRRWLRNAGTAMSVEGSGDLLERLTEQNVLLQMQHLRTHPSVAAALARGELSISGWIYDIARGTVRVREDGGSGFVEVG